MKSKAEIQEELARAEAWTEAARTACRLRFHEQVVAETLAWVLNCSVSRPIQEEYREE